MLAAASGAHPHIQYQQHAYYAQDGPGYRGQPGWQPETGTFSGHDGMQLQSEVEEDSILHFLGADLIRGVLEEETLTIPASHEQPPFIQAQVGGGSGGTAAFFSQFQSPFPIPSPTSTSRVDPLPFPSQQPTQRHDAAPALHVERMGIAAMHANEQGAIKDTVEQYKQMVQHNQQQHQRQYEYMQQQRRQQQGNDNQQNQQQQHLQQKQPKQLPHKQEPQSQQQSKVDQRQHNNATQSSGSVHSKAATVATTVIPPLNTSAVVTHLRGGGGEEEIPANVAAAAQDTDLQVPGRLIQHTVSMTSMSLLSHQLRWL
jgi:hypothetical protein